MSNPVKKRESLMMERFERLRAWMRDKQVTFAWTAKKMGVSATAVSRMVRSERITTRRHAELVAIGYPPELLPRAENFVHRGRKPMVPVWEQANPATL